MTSDPASPIAELVASFLELANGVVAGRSGEGISSLSGELDFELARVITAYLDQHQLPLEQFDALERGVLDDLSSRVQVDNSETSLDPDGLRDTSLGHDLATYVDHVLMECQHDPGAPGLEPMFG